MGWRERLDEVKAGRKNVGGFERWLRGTVGPALFIVGVASLLGVLTLAAGTLGLGLGVIMVLAGLRMTQTAVTQRCYMNALIGRDSCRVEAPEGDGPGASEA